MNKETEKKIYVAGHKGMVGSAIVRSLKKKGFNNLLLASKKELDLTNQSLTYSFLEEHKPDYIFLSAAKVGGILANNTYKADFLIQNMLIQNNIIYGAFKANIKNLCFLGSSCIYPKNCKKPIKEEYLLTGPLEETNEPYALAKISGLKLCESLNFQYGTNYVSLMPTNVYGPNDNFDEFNSHVLAALIRKVHKAKLDKEENIILWGTGTAKREFIYVDDLADACTFIMTEKQLRGIFNIGTGFEISIKELAHIIMDVIGVDFKIIYDKTKPDGMLSKVLDSSKINNLGWKPKFNFRDGIRLAYNAYLENMK
tara:strand:+ start:127 stop:1062 length:936 start_codon:yes stop_codon:yes gene_type:complete